MTALSEAHKLDFFTRLQIKYAFTMQFLSELQRQSLSIDNVKLSFSITNSRYLKW